MEIRQKVKAKVLFEIVGNPKDHVVDALKKYVNLIKGDPTLKVSEEYIAEPEEKDGLWSTFAEMDITMQGMEKLTWLCVNFTPASVEIMEPSSFEMTDKGVTDWLNDLLSKLHEIGMHAKGLSSENDLLKLNINRLIRNTVANALKYVEKPLNHEELAMEVGIQDKEHIVPFLDAMVKEGRILKDGLRYRLP